MKLVTYLLVIAIFCSCQQKVSEQDKNDEVELKIDYVLIPPYEEENICSIFSSNNVIYISERFKVFDKQCSTDIFSKIDSICAIGVKKKTENKTVYIEYWKFKDSQEVSSYISNLEIIKNSKGLRYKPPTFWSWKAQDKNVLFFYSLETPPTDSFFEYVFNNHKEIVDDKNCCE